jgi:hypothetical protein
MQLVSLSNSVERKEISMSSCKKWNWWCKWTWINECRSLNSTYTNEKRDFDMIWNDNTYSLFTHIHICIVICWYICVCVCVCVCVCEQRITSTSKCCSSVWSFIGWTSTCDCDGILYWRYTQSKRENTTETEREKVLYLHIFNTHTHFVWYIYLTLFLILTLTQIHTTNLTHNHSLNFSCFHTLIEKKRENVFFSLNMRYMYVCVYITLSLYLSLCVNVNEWMIT